MATACSESQHIKELGKKNKKDIFVLSAIAYIYINKGT